MLVLKALAAGVLVGVILIEAVLAGLRSLVPESALIVNAGEGFVGPLIWPLLPLPAVIWMLGAALGGAMAAAMAPKPGWGLGVGALLGLTAFVLVGMVTPGNPAALFAVTIPLAGAAAGTALAARLRREDATVSASGQAV
ncbi:MAG: hypothetical protein U5L08_11730 [Xanthomonadales bacterium]|nr:hypothetical protein [Xanthomonadales bacterium]